MWIQGVVSCASLACHATAVDDDEQNTFISDEKNQQASESSNLPVTHRFWWSHWCQERVRFDMSGNVAGPTLVLELKGTNQATNKKKMQSGV